MAHANLRLQDVKSFKDVVDSTAKFPPELADNLTKSKTSVQS